MSLKNIIIAVVLGSALAGGIFVATLAGKPPLPKSAFVIPLLNELPEFTLQDQSGELVNADTFRGQWDLVFFGFTNCPDVCPTTLQLLASVKKQLLESELKELPRIVLLSVDPERDTPDLLATYVDYFGSGNLGVTGDLSEIKKLTSALGIYFEKVPNSPLDSGSSDNSGNYNVNHSAAVLLINPDAQFSALFSAPHKIENYLHDLPLIMVEN
jgi:protein SCO1/2